jgi:lysozyme
MQREAIRIAASICKSFEGFKSAPYLCPAGVPTIGYGSTFYPSKIKVTLQDQSISAEQADRILMQVLSMYAQDILKISPTLNESESNLGAVLSFAYNLGVSRYRASTLRSRIDNGDCAGARVEIVKWTRCGGRVLQGLVRRRQAEANFLV